MRQDDLLPYRLIQTKKIRLLPMMGGSLLRLNKRKRERRQQRSLRKR
jgi:hypothetical protein